ncbi:glycerol-3-phosphate dehydrogenase [soil metagenome]
MFEQVYDLAVIGGGITGCAIARDASGRGLSVFLCERGDIGSGSSSATDRLVHGGLHHLERLEFEKLRRAQIEAEILMRTAPHLVRPLRFLLPHHSRQWPRWAIGLGLFAYDHAARRSLPKARRTDIERADNDQMLRGLFRHGFAFFDCIADDSRLAMVNALDAHQRGAVIAPRTRCVVAERERGRWRLSLVSERTGEWTVAFATMLINAGGGEAGAVHDHVIHANRRTAVRVTKASRLVVRSPIAPDRAYSLPTAGGHIVYAVPHAPGFMLLGSAESRFEGEALSPNVDAREAAYLIDAANQYFHDPISAADIVRGVAGFCVMPEDPAAAHIDYAALVEAPPGSAPLVSVFGGTLTTFRLVAEEVIDRLSRFHRVGGPWTASAPLPGGNFPPDSGAPDLCRAIRAAWPFVPQDLAHRLVLTYGTRAPTILTGARSLDDLGPWFGAELSAAEVTFLRRQEWATTAEDVLWRRTRLGLRLTAAEAEALAGWMAETAVPA